MSIQIPSTPNMLTISKRDGSVKCRDTPHEVSFRASFSKIRLLRMMLQHFPQAKSIRRLFRPTHTCAKRARCSSLNLEQLTSGSRCRAKYQPRATKLLANGNDIAQNILRLQKCQRLAV